MKTGKVLGIVGGILGLLIGIVFAGAMAMAGEAAGLIGAGGDNVGLKVGLFSIVVLGIPTLAIIGAVKTEKTPKQSLWLLGVPAIASVLLGVVLGGGAAALIFGIPGLLMGLGTLFIWKGMKTARV